MTYSSDISSNKNVVTGTVIHIIFSRDLALNGVPIDYTTTQNILMPSNIAIIGL